MRVATRPKLGLAAILALATLGMVPGAPLAPLAAKEVAITCLSESQGGRSIDFEGPSDGTALGETFRDVGVRFGDTARSTPRALWSGADDGVRLSLDPDRAASSAGLPLRIRFDKPQSTVGLDAINPDPDARIVTASLTMLDGAGRVLDSVAMALRGSEPRFMVIATGSPEIATAVLDYGATAVPETIDNLCYGGRLPGMHALNAHRPKPPPSLPAAPRDLSIRGFEITQAIQCFASEAGADCPANSVQLATNKTTMLRVYGRATGMDGDVPNVPYRLYMIAGNQGYVIDASGPATTSLRRQLNDSANLTFLPSFNAPVTVTAYVEIDPNNTISEVNEGNNRFPASGSLSFVFEPTRDRRVVGRIVDYDWSGFSGQRRAEGPAVNGTGATWLEVLTPVRDGGIDYELASGELDWSQPFWVQYDQQELKRTLNEEWFTAVINSIAFGKVQPAASAHHYYGWISLDMARDGTDAGGSSDPRFAGGLGIVAYGVGDSGGVVDEPDIAQDIFAHELMHLHDVRHLNTPDACGSRDSKTDWPYATGTIQEFGVNPLTGTVYDPADTHDTMSYCPAGGIKAWISPFHWNKLFDRLRTGAASAVSPSTAAEPEPTGESILVNLTVGDDDVVELRPASRVAVDLAINPTRDEPTPYAVELRAGSTVLLSEPFVVSLEDESGEALDHDDVLLSMPYHTAATSIVVTKDGVVLAERVVSASAPDVTVHAVPVEFAPGSSHTLSWSGSDADDDALTYTVLYSIDDTNWDVLASGLDGTSLAVEADTLAGSEAARFRVVATDGVNTGYGESAAVLVPDQLPIVELLAPEAGVRIGAGTPVILRGTGTDREEGSLSDAALEWSSDRQGLLGTGGTLVIDGLATGRHTISLRGHQLDGRFTERSVLVDVASVADPVLTPSPAGVGEQVVARATIGAPFDVAELTCTVDYGDGSGEQAGTISSRTCVGPGHEYAAVSAYPVIVRLYDASRELTWSSASVTVIDTTPPEVAIVRGLEGGLYVADAVFVAGGAVPVMAGPVTIEATATDAETGVVWFEFVIDGAPVSQGETRFDPERNVYSFVYRSPSPGLHSVVARASNGSLLVGSAETRPLGLSP